jgi:hypothetical protein
MPIRLENRKYYDARWRNFRLNNCSSGFFFAAKPDIVSSLRR